MVAFLFFPPPRRITFCLFLEVTLAEPEKSFQSRLVDQRALQTIAFIVL